MSMESWLERMSGGRRKTVELFNSLGSVTPDRKTVEPAREDAHKAYEEVHSPSHYQGAGMECIDAIRAALGPEGFVAYCRGNAIKYSWRAGKKGPNVASDMGKAAVYANWAAEVEL